MRSLSKKARIRLGFWGSVFLVYVIVFWVVGCADYFILHPSRKAIDAHGARDELIDSPVGKLELWTVRSRAAGVAASRGQEPMAYVLECIPNAGRAEYAWAGVEDWTFFPVEYVSLNYPGYGGSEGKATLEGVHRSALAAYDAIAARANGKPIYVTGMSLGSAAALHVAANRPVAGVVVQNPVPLRQLILGKFGWWNLWLAAGPVALDVPGELDALANASKVTVPAVFVLAELDELVPPKYQERVFAAYAGPKKRVGFRGGHNDPVEGTAAATLREAMVWLWEQQFGPVSPTVLPADPGALRGGMRGEMQGREAGPGTRPATGPG